jgi:hypothetical protein
MRNYFSGQRIFAVLLCLALAGIANAREVPVVTGEHWTQATEKEKKAFLLGMATMIMIEYNLQQKQPVPSEATVVPELVEGLSEFSFEDVISQLDGYYQAEPDQIKRPVVETIWFEMVIPNLKAK